MLLIARAKVNTFFPERGDKKSWRCGPDRKRSPAEHHARRRNAAQKLRNRSLQ
jgi:hypothetical protein